MNRRQFLKGTAISLTAAGAGCAGYAIGIEPHWLEIVEQNLKIANLPPLLRGARMVQLSDLHVGPVNDEYLMRSLDRARALAPDIVAITGDLISQTETSDESRFARLRHVLTHVPRGRIATIGVLGNHDYGHGWRDARVAARVVSEMERAGIRVLRNEIATLDGLDVIGVDDLWSTHADSLTALRARQNAAALVLVHNPDAADQLPWPEYQGWMLSGHTHGGQCKPPFLPPPLLPVRNRRYVAGVTPVDGNRTLYINRGIGHFLRARFNVRPELTVFTLQA